MHSPTLGELATALAKAQAEMPLAEATATNPFFKSKYTDMAMYIKTSRPALARNGLSVSQFITPGAHGQQLCTMLLHASGEYLSSIAEINPPKTDIQSLGSYLTYLKRYMYASMVGCVSGSEDDDGESAMERNRNNKPVAESDLLFLKKTIEKKPEIESLLLRTFKIDTIEKIPAQKMPTIIEWIKSL